MSEQERDEQLIAERAHLLPEEEAAGSADAERQAEIILQDSLERTDDPEATQAGSSQTPGGD